MSECDQICWITPDSSLTRTVQILRRCKSNPYILQTSALSTLSSSFDLWPLYYHIVLHWKERKIAEHCWTHYLLLCSIIYRDPFIVVTFIVKASEIAARVSVFFSVYFWQENAANDPSSTKKKKKINQTVVIFLVTAYLSCWLPTADFAATANQSCQLLLEDRDPISMWMTRKH